jgi:hypothetical protein
MRKWGSNGWEGKDHWYENSNGTNWWAVWDAAFAPLCLLFFVIAAAVWSWGITK